MHDRILTPSGLLYANLGGFTIAFEENRGWTIERLGVLNHWLHYIGYFLEKTLCSGSVLIWTVNISPLPL